MQDRQVANSDALFHTLEATGYLDDGQAARGVLLGETAGADRRWRSFEPDARWESNAELRVYFKTVPSFLPDSTVSEWRK